MKLLVKAMAALTLSGALPLITICFSFRIQPIRVTRRRCTLDYHQVPHILLELAVRLRNPDINEVSVIDKASQRLPFF